MEYKYIIVERIENNVVIIILNCPKEHNALSSSLVKELTYAIEACEEDKTIGAIILIGGPKIFAVGADIKELFEQPEIKLGIILGIGGTQRLTKAVGKSKAMEMCLTGNTIDAIETKEYNLVSQVYKESDLLNEAVLMAKKIASMLQVAIKLIKEFIGNSYEVPLHSGLENERKNFYSTFSLEDKKEGMSAFIEKRKPVFRNK